MSSCSVGVLKEALWIIMYCLYVIKQNITANRTAAMNRHLKLILCLAVFVLIGGCSSEYLKPYTTAKDVVESNYTLEHLMDMKRLSKIFRSSVREIGWRFVETHHTPPDVSAIGDVSWTISTKSSNTSDPAKHGLPSLLQRFQKIWFTIIYKSCRV